MTESNARAKGTTRLLRVVRAISTLFNSASRIPLGMQPNFIHFRYQSRRYMHEETSVKVVAFIGETMPFAGCSLIDEG
jgi:hypothetical protein